MLKYFSILLFSTLVLFSCRQKADQEKATLFAMHIHKATTGVTKATQQAFVDTMTLALKTIQQDRTATIDTKALRVLLNKAQEANRKSFTELNSLTEVDNTINLKEKALAENEMFRSLYEHEFNSIIDALESKAPDKMTILDHLIAAFSAKEDTIRTTQRNAKEAGYDFEKKYDIKMPESE
ncbi:hypothetical protein [Ferruginibacter sp. SUN106]|uniref:hypothetical protein n=1 Tax=Ferruginibacter sp. SUN106 TaxID=2978348 RepID=UPI003D359D6A